MVQSTYVVSYPHLHRLPLRAEVPQNLSCTIRSSHKSLRPRSIYIMIPQFPLDSGEMSA